MKVAPSRRRHIVWLASQTFPDDVSDDVLADDKKRAALQRKMAHEMKDFLRSASSPDELHLFAENWNWDGGIAPLLQLVRNPHCDAGTALTIFWRGCPEDFYSSYRTPKDLPRVLHGS